MDLNAIETNEYVLERVKKLFQDNTEALKLGQIQKFIESVIKEQTRTMYNITSTVFKILVASGYSVDYIMNQLSSIPERGFTCFDFEDTDIKLKDNIDGVGQYGFSGSNITSIDFNKAKYLRTRAFSGSQLREVTLNPQFNMIEPYVFEGCTSMTKAYVDLPVIPHGMFSECRNLRKVELTPGMNRIGSEAFFNCRSLYTVDIPETVETIDTRAFELSGIKVVKLPLGLKVISDQAFPRNANIIVDHRTYERCRFDFNKSGNRYNLEIV